MTVATILTTTSVNESVFYDLVTLSIETQKNNRKWKAGSKWFTVGKKKSNVLFFPNYLKKLTTIKMNRSK
jgi:hypothetical protein